MRTVKELDAQSAADRKYWTGAVKRRIAEIAIARFELDPDLTISASDLDGKLNDLPERYIRSIPGGAFQSFRKRGYLVQVGYAKSTTTSRKGGIIAQYRVNPEAVHHLREIVQSGGAGEPDHPFDGREAPEVATVTGNGETTDPTRGSAEATPPSAEPDLSLHLFDVPEETGNYTDPDQRKAA